MKLFPLAAMLCALAGAVENPQLQRVRSVYILPMSGGMDQYLANKISRQGLFVVVTDPQRADAILTESIGESFEEKLDELYPPPKPVKAPKAPADSTAAKASDDDKSAPMEAESSSKGLLDAGPPEQHANTFSRAKGTVFLVDRRSRAVIWSTYDRPRDHAADTLDKKADEIVTRLKRDLKETK